MASVFKRNGYYVVKWKNSVGRQQTQRTRFVTKPEARLYAMDLEHQAQRQRAGLAPTLKKSELQTFGQLADWWETECRGRYRSHTIFAFVKKHLVPAFGPLPLSSVTAGKIDELMAKKEKRGADGMPQLAPKSVNQLREVVHRMFKLAKRREKWSGENPASDVPRRKVPKRIPTVLKSDEVDRLLQALHPRWRPIFATALFTAMRQGELLGLRKIDVDLDDDTVTVARSYDQDTTKGGHADVLPLLPALKPYLVTAMKLSTSHLVFPKADGSMHTQDLALDRVLRRALGRAGIVTGYKHSCRRCKARGHKAPAVRASDATLRNCERCGMKLWASAIPRHVRFHDLRHSTATLLLKSGVPLAVVQKILRHSDPRVTAEVYGHLDLDDMRLGLMKLRFGEQADAPPID